MKIYGKNAVKEAIKANRKVYKVYLDDVAFSKEKGFVEILKNNNIPFTVLKRGEFDKEFKGNNQGFGADVEDYKYYELEDIVDKSKKQYFLILDQIEDPQNLGAIIRTADATEIDGIIIPKNHSVSLNQTVVKVSTGAIEYVRLIQVNNLAKTIDYLKDNGFWVVGTTLDAKKKYTEIDPSVSLAVVIGNEGFGMSKLIKNKCDYNVTIPMSGHVNSLNASVSAALLLYEIYRKRD